MYLHDHNIVHWDLKYVTPPLYHSPSLSIFAVISESDLWLVNRPEIMHFRTKDQSSDIVIAFWHVGRLKFLAGDMSHMYHTPFSSVLNTSILPGAAHVCRRKSRIRSSRGAEPKGTWQV